MKKKITLLIACGIALTFQSSPCHSDPTANMKEKLILWKTRAQETIKERNSRSQSPTSPSHSPSLSPEEDRKMRLLLNQIISTPAEIQSYLQSPLSCPLVSEKRKYLELNEKDLALLTEIQASVTQKPGCSADPAELKKKMVDFLALLDRDQNYSKIYSTDVKKSRKARFDCLKTNTEGVSPIVNTLFQTPSAVNVNSVQHVNKALSQCSGTLKEGDAGTKTGPGTQRTEDSSESVALDSVPSTPKDTQVPESIPQEVKSVYQDIFKAMDHARRNQNSSSSPSYTVNLLVPGNNDLSNAAYVAQQALALREYANLHPGEKLKVKCITMGFGGYPTTAEFKNTMVVSKDPKGALIRDEAGHPSGTGIPEAEALARVIKNMSGLECEQERYSTTTAENVLKVNSLLGTSEGGDSSQIFFLSGAKTGSGRQADIFANNLDPKIGQLYSLPMRRTSEYLTKLSAQALAYHYMNGLKEVFGDYICQFQGCGGEKGYSLIGVKPMTPQFEALIQRALQEVSCFTPEETQTLADKNVNDAGNIINAIKDKLQNSIPKALDETQYSEEIERLGKDPLPILGPILR